MNLMNAESFLRTCLKYRSRLAAHACLTKSLIIVLRSLFCLPFAPRSAVTDVDLHLPCQRLMLLHMALRLIVGTDLMSVACTLCKSSFASGKRDLALNF